MPSSRSLDRKVVISLSLFLLFVMQLVYCSDTDQFPSFDGDRIITNKLAQEHRRKGNIVMAGGVETFVIEEGTGESVTVLLTGVGEVTMSELVYFRCSKSG